MQQLQLSGLYNQYGRLCHILGNYEMALELRGEAHGGRALQATFNLAHHYQWQGDLQSAMVLYEGACRRGHPEVLVWENMVWKFRRASWEVVCDVVLFVCCVFV